MLRVMADRRWEEELVVFVPSPRAVMSLEERSALPTFWLFAPGALELLAWVGLPRESFGAHDARDVAARCRRRLWPIPRNHDGSGLLRHRTQMLLVLAEAAGDGWVLFS